jgi:hypothetical protein
LSRASTPEAGKTWMAGTSPAMTKMASCMYAAELREIKSA